MVARMKISLIISFSLFGGPGLARAKNRDLSVRQFDNLRQRTERSLKISNFCLPQTFKRGGAISGKRRHICLINPGEIYDNKENRLAAILPHRPDAHYRFRGKRLLLFS